MVAGMTTASLSIPNLAQLFGTARSKAARLLSSPAIKADRDALLFSAKTFAAAMLAYYVALRIGLPKPYWAILTVYIVSQTSAGASFGRGIYRLAGTILGAVATVAIVPNFANEPVLCGLILACWIGLCLYFSLLDRTPRAYGFVLAGYTASLIGFPGVADPGAMFNTAAVRVQEIGLGIACAVLIHRFIAPRRMTGQFNAKLASTLADARSLGRQALLGEPVADRRGRRAMLACDLLALNGLAAHLPYDDPRSAPPRETLHRLHDGLARLIPLASEIEVRVHRLSALSLAESDLRQLIEDCRHWLASAESDRQETPRQLSEQARFIRTQLLADPLHHDNALGANLCGHLVELIALFDDCDRLGAFAQQGGRPQRSVGGTGNVTGYVHHRDHRVAARAALGAVVGVFSACLLWIWSAWSDGALALSIVGVACALFGNIDTPKPAVIKYLIGSLYAVVLGLAYSFIILPRVSDFPVLVAVLAPVLLWAGSLQARPPTMLMALGITLSFPILTGLGSRYTGDFATYLNSTVALVVGTGFAAVSMSLFQTVPARQAITRLLRLSRRDVARRAQGRAIDEARWTGLMIDRTALLLPRARQAKAGETDPVGEVLLYLRVGHVVGLLRQKTADGHADAGDVSALLGAVARAFSGEQKPGDDALNRLAMQADIERAKLPGGGGANGADLRDLLIDLSFALNAHNATGKGHPA